MLLQGSTPSEPNHRDTPIDAPSPSCGCNVLTHLVPALSSGRLLAFPAGAEAARWARRDASSSSRAATAALACCRSACAVASSAVEAERSVCALASAERRVSTSARRPSTRSRSCAALCCCRWTQYWSQQHCYCIKRGKSMLFPGLVEMRRCKLDLASWPSSECSLPSTIDEPCPLSKVAQHHQMFTAERSLSAQRPVTPV